MTIRKTLRKKVKNIAEKVVESEKFDAFVEEAVDVVVKEIVKPEKKKKAIKSK